MALRLIPKILDPIDMVSTLSKQLGVINSDMVKVTHIEHVIAVQRVGKYDAIRDDFLPLLGQQSGGLHSRNNLRLNPPTTL